MAGSFKQKTRGITFGILCAIGAASGFGLGNAVLKVLYKSFGNIAFQDLLFMRTVVTLVFFFIIALKTGVSCLKVTKKELLFYLFAGSAGFFAVSYFLLLSLSMIPAGMTAFTQSSSTIMICLFSFFVFKERITRKKWLAIGIGLIGLAFVVLAGGGWNGQSILAAGILAAFASAVGKSIYILSGRVAGRQKKKVPMMVYGMTVCALLSFPLTSPMETYVRLFSDWHSALALIAYCFIFSSIPYLLAFRAAEIIPASTSGSLNVIEPVVTSFSAFVILHEKLYSGQLIGAALIVVSVLLNSRETARIEREEQEAQALREAQEARKTQGH